MPECSEGCGRTTDRPDGRCFACHVKGLSFTFRGAHLGRASFHDTTVESELRSIKANAGPNGWRDLERI